SPAHTLDQSLLRALELGRSGCCAENEGEWLWGYRGPESSYRDGEFARQDGGHDHLFDVVASIELLRIGAHVPVPNRPFGGFHDEIEIVLQRLARRIGPYEGHLDQVGQGSQRYLESLFLSGVERSPFIPELQFDAFGERSYRRWQVDPAEALAVVRNA